MPTNKDSKEINEMNIPKNNLCAKHMNTFNKPATHADRKYNEKNGKRKHKKDFADE